MDKILYLMRHGQTLFNVRRKIQGVCDAPLTPLGVELNCILRSIKLSLTMHTLLHRREPVIR